MYQGQSLISPSNISMLTWNAILTGGIIGLTRINIAQPSILNKSMLEKRRSLILGLALSMLGMVITYPLFNVDRLQLLSSRTGNGDLAIKSALSYPQSSVRYSRISDAFVDSGLDLPALNLARSAVNFNANSISSWGLILLSPAASYEERMNAKNQVLRLDPLNDSVQSYVVPE